MTREAEPAYAFGPFHLDPSELLLLRDGQSVPLTPKVFAVLRVLVENAGHLVEKERLLAEAWPGTFVEEGALSRSVSVLRKALGERPEGEKYIETVPTRGYRFVALVTEYRADRIAPQTHGRVETDATRTNGLRAPQEWSLRAGWSAGIVGVVGVLVALGAVAYLVATLPEPARRPASALAPTHSQVTFSGNEGSPALSPDGRRLAYVLNGTAESTLMVRELAGGDPRAIVRAPGVGRLRWSPDGSELIMWAAGPSGEGLYLTPHSGGTSQRIAARQFVACWSPDGSIVAVGHYLVGQISFVNKHGDEQRRISLQGNHSWISDIDWSAASGLLIVVTSDERGRASVWTVRPNGSDQQRVFSSESEIPAARWAPHGDAIYFFQRVNQTVSLFKIQAPWGRDPPSPVTTLLSGLETDGSLSLSADGTRLTYARAPFHSNLWLLETIGEGASLTATTKALTDGTSLIERPRVSPNGQSIVFNVGHEPAVNLYTMPTTGGTPRQLTFLGSFNVGGVWSPDGRSIAFASTQGGTRQIWAIPAAGGVPQPLGASDVSETFDLTWSPGSAILYQQTGNRNYYELDPESRQERPLLKDSSVGWIFSPVYSPDGRKVAVAWNRRANRGIWIIDSKDRRETPVYSTSSPSTMPIGWSPDGQSIYAAEGRRPTFRGMTLPRGETLVDVKILRVPVNGGTVTTVATLPLREIGGVSMTPDGRRFVYTLYSSRSDVWVVDNFDVPPESRINSR